MVSLSGKTSDTEMDPNEKRRPFAGINKRQENKSREGRRKDATQNADESRGQYCIS